MLENNLHHSSIVATLTYDDSNLPVFISQTHGPLATLQTTHYKNWLKRLRSTVSPSLIRFYIAGEYGDESWRPHYHAIIFNFPQCDRGTTLRDLRNKPIPEKCCDSCRLILKTWGHGNILVDTLSTQSAQYCAGYVMKKMTHRNDPRLLGRDPEFQRMSLKPGLGLGFMDEVASTLLQYDLEQTERDVPVTLRHGSKQLPLGRYLRKNLRKLIGRDEKAPQEIIDENSKRLQALHLLHKNDPGYVSVDEKYKETIEGQNKSADAIAKIFKQRKSL